jgi:hypothetical protein
MTEKLVTIVTPTLGDSAGHLNRQMIDLREMTSLKFRQVVSDDGTIDEGQRHRQRSICNIWGADWGENKCGTYGISYNMNNLLEQVTTPWALLVEDGLRPSLGWLETATDAIEKIGSKKWLGHSVGMIGTASFNDWHLKLAGALPGNLSVMDFLHRTTAETYSAFWGSSDHPNWNDGLWCWKRMWPGFVKSCWSPESESWPKTPAPWNFVHLVRYGKLPEAEPSALTLPALGVFIDGDAANLDQSRHLDFKDVWPARRTAGPAWFPGAFALINMEAWRAVGKFRDGCPFFEGHFGIRLAKAGWLSLYTEFPPWLHYGGMGFINGPTQARGPRHHELTDGDGPGDIFFRDFGCNGPGHTDVYSLVHKQFPQDKITAISQELSGVELHMDDRWKEWL